MDLPRNIVGISIIIQKCRINTITNLIYYSWNKKIKVDLFLEQVKILTGREEPNIRIYCIGRNYYNMYTGLRAFIWRYVNVDEVTWCDSKPYQRLAILKEAEKRMILDMMKYSGKQCE